MGVVGERGCGRVYMLRSIHDPNYTVGMQRRQIRLSAAGVNPAFPRTQLSPLSSGQADAG
jgi:hypothetical protein